jgi:AcrR family transcriptional regulator
MRDRLLDAAEQVVTRDGVSSLTLDAVAREAGVSKGGLLYHFPSKSQLVTEVVERMACSCEAEHNANVSSEPAGPGAFTRAYLATRAARVERVLAPGSNCRPLHTAIVAGAGTDPQYLEPFRQRASRWQEQLEDDGIDPVIATIVRLAIDGLGWASMLDMPLPETELRKAVVERLFEMTRTASQNGSRPPPETTEAAVK